MKLKHKLTTILLVILIILGFLNLSSWFDRPTPIPKIFSGLDEFGVNIKINDDSTDQRVFPAVAVEDGAIYVVWQDYRDSASGPDIYFTKSMNNGTTFSPNIKVNDESVGSPTIQKTPEIAVANKHLYVVWEDYRNGFTDSDIYLAHSPDEGEYFEPSVEVNVDEVGTEKDWAPTVGVDKTSGNVYVAWVHGQDSNKIIAARSTDEGQSFQNVDVSDTTVYDRGDPDIEVDRNGKVYVVWKDGRSGPVDVDGTLYESENDVFIANSTDGGLSFGTNKRVNEPYANIRQFSPSLAIDGNDNLHIAWLDERFIFKLFSVMYTRSSDGSNFSPNVPVNFSAPTDFATARTKHQAPSIAVDQSGTLVNVVWYDNRGGSNNIYMAKSIDGGLSFEPANCRFDGNYFLDSIPTYNGVYDNNEAVVLDNGNGILDPGVLNGSDSPDKITVSGNASLKETNTVLLYYDANSNFSWDSDEPIIFDTLPKTFSGIEVDSKTPWDNIIPGPPLSYLRHNDSKYYIVNYTEVMGLDGFNTSDKGIQDDDPISSAILDIVYNTTVDYMGTAPVNWSLEGGTNSSLFTPLNTNGKHVETTIDIYQWSVDNVTKLKTVNISFENNDALNPTSEVRFDKLTLRVERGQSIKFDKYDLIVYNGSVAVPGGSDISPFSPLDRITYMDIDLNGTYSLGEPVIQLSHDFGYLDANDTVLQRSNNENWIAYFTPFPLNEFPNSQVGSPSMAADRWGNAFVVWKDARTPQPNIYFTNVLDDSWPPEVDDVEATASHIKIVFSEPVNTSSFDSAFSIDPTIDGTWSWDLYGFTATLNPVQPLIPTTFYEFVITTALEDLSGNHMLTDYFYNFTTPAVPLIMHSVVEVAVVNRPAQIDAKILDTDGIMKATVFHKKIDQVNLTQGNMTLVSGTGLSGHWTYSMPSPSNLTPILYYLEAQDVFGDKTREPLIGYHVITVIDLYPPVIQHTRITNANLGSEVTVEAVVSDDLEVEHVLLYVKPVAADNFNPPIEMTDSGNGYSTKINVGDESGILEYYILAVDPYGNEAISPSNGRWMPNELEVSKDPYYLLIFVFQIIGFVLMFIQISRIRKLRSYET